MVNKLFSIRRLRIGALFTTVGLVFIILFLIFFKGDGLNNSVEKGKFRTLKNQNVINLKELNENMNSSKSNKVQIHEMDERIKMEEAILKNGKEKGKSKEDKSESFNNNEFKNNNKNNNKNDNDNDNDNKNENDQVDLEESEEMMNSKTNNENEKEKIEDNIEEKEKEKEKEEEDEEEDEEKTLEKIIERIKEKEKEKEMKAAQKLMNDEVEQEFDMKEYTKSVHLESTSSLNFFKLYHRGNNYRDGDDPEGKECPVPWKWVDNQEDSDIIVMNVLDNLGDIMRIERYSYEKTRQKLLLMSMESTSNYEEMITKKKYFNYMIDYRLDSDVPIPYTYGFFNFAKPPLPLEHKGKFGRGLAAVFISNCGARNKRLEFLNELMLYAKIDSFGMCANNKDVYPEDMADSAWSTKMNTIRKYKFTLAFENSDDRDYVTEKFFQPLEAGSVPVFYGTSNIADFAPPHSYIDAKDFSSAKELAEYLEFLDQNDDEYESYLEWKKTGDLGTSFKRVIEIRKLNSICYLLQRIKGMWINPFLTIWNRDDVSENERACGLC